MKNQEQAKKKKSERHRILIDLTYETAKELNVIAAEADTDRKLLIEQKLEKIAKDSRKRKQK